MPHSFARVTAISVASRTDHLPETAAAVQTGDGSRVEFDRRLRIGDHLAVSPTFHVLAEPAHPVRLVAGEI